MTERRYPLSALVEASGLSEAALARRVGLSGSTLKNAREVGLLERSADRYAVRAGLHPWTVWPEMEAHAAADAEAAEVRVREAQRAADRRHKAKLRRDPAFRARQAEYLREYRSSDRAREVARRYRRSYYERNRERELERQRAYDATVRAERRRQQREGRAA